MQPVCDITNPTMSMPKLSFIALVSASLGPWLAQSSMHCTTIILTQTLTTQWPREAGQKVTRLSFGVAIVKFSNFTADTNNPAWEHISSFGWGLASYSKKSNAIRSTSTIRLLCQSALSPNPHDGLCFYTQLLPKPCKAMWNLCL